MYLNLLRDGGKLRFKTDNVGLFDFSLEEIEAMGLVPDIVTRDLHASKWNEGNIKTEYETAFSEQGIKINMLEITKPNGMNPEISSEFLTKRNYEN
jgi:tRNA (guanine-N7-)-methyltransferase